MLPSSTAGSLNLADLLKKVAPLLVLVLVYLYLLVLSWYRWPDAISDYGRELYSAWMIANGYDYYVHFINPYGPLASYINGFLFYVFGDSIHVLVVFNLVLTSLFLGGLYYLFGRAYGYWLGLCVSLLFLTISALSNLWFFGSVNFICPYSHDALYSFYICVAGIASIVAHEKNNKKYLLFLFGTALSLTFISKPEFFVALCGFAFIYAALRLYRGDKVDWAKSCLAAVSGFVVIISIVFAYFSINYDANTAITVIFKAIAETQSDAVRDMPYFVECMGLMEPLKNTMIVLLVGGLGILWYYVVVQRMRFPKYTLFLTVILVVASFFIGRYCFEHIPRGYIIWCPLIFLYAAYKAKTDRLMPLYAALAIFACGLLAKRLLLNDFSHYGFLLSLPASLTIVAFLLWHRISICRDAKFGIIFASFLLGISLEAHNRSWMFYQAKSYHVDGEIDSFYTWDPALGINAYGPLYNNFIEWQKKSIPEDATFVVVSDGIMLNYLARKKSTLVFTNYNPHDYFLLGESGVIDSIRESAPDFFIWIYINVSRFGRGQFGSPDAYGYELVEFIGSNYTPIYLDGADPRLNKSSGLMVLRRNDLLQ